MGEKRGRGGRGGRRCLSISRGIIRGVIGRLILRYVFPPFFFFFSSSFHISVSSLSFPFFLCEWERISKKLINLILLFFLFLLSLFLLFFWGGSRCALFALGLEREYKGNDGREWRLTVCFIFYCRVSRPSDRYRISSPWIAKLPPRSTYISKKNQGTRRCWRHTNIFGSV